MNKIYKNLFRQFCKYKDDISRDIKYTEYINKRIGLENPTNSLEDRFWRLWKYNIFRKTKKYKEDDYEFMCVKTDYHKKK